jgi:membrane-bound lytic murein transglycosylase MltF
MCLSRARRAFASLRFFAMPPGHPRSTRGLAGLGLAMVLAGGIAAAQVLEPTPTPPPANPKTRGLTLTQKLFTGDFDQMLERRFIRVLVPYSRTLYFNDKGRERGVTAGLVREFERYLNKKYKRKLGKRPLTVYIYPTTRDKLMPYLLEGAGDIAGGNLTATPKRLKIVDFVTATDLKPISELVVTGPGAPPIASVDDLAGKTVHVRRASSYHENLEALNVRFQKEGRAAIKLEILPDALEDEDLLEMVNAGLVRTVVVDSWKAHAWSKVLPRIQVHDDVAVAAGDRLGWAHRKNSPGLHAVLADFYRTVVKREAVIEELVVQFHRRLQQIANNTGGAEWKRFEDTISLFYKYGEKYGFDPLMLAAQGFQESGLDQAARSPSGAIGIMQILPAVGRELQVGDIRIAEPNIHAGAKYMDKLMADYFSDAKFSERDRPLFAFASYNCGPAAVARMRKEAARRGLDPNQWFNNVEVVVAQRLGIETPTYVRNIYKYYVAYKLQLSAIEAQKKAREQVGGR